MENLDDPGRVDELRQRIQNKGAIRQFYLEVYSKYRECLERCPEDGVALELGAGGGFTKSVLPFVRTSDVIAYPGVDEVIDATKMPFEDSSLRFIGMLNVFHHIRDVEAFLREARRCLKKGGRVLIVDEYPGLVGYPVYRWIHHEPFRPKAKEWRFESSGPLSDANGALAWMVFERDRVRFEKLFPEMKIVRFQPHTPFRYWLAGGLKKWSLLPSKAFGLATKLDRGLCGISPRFASFVDIELEKTT